MARTFFIPGHGVVVEDGEEEYFVPGHGVLSEDNAPAAGGFIPYPNPRYALTGGMQPLSGGV